jgi:hypothetical protein
MIIHAAILMGFAITLGCLRVTASTMVLDLFLEPPVHSYAPEWILQIPSSGTSFTMAAQSEDMSICPNAAGMIINLEAVTLIEFNLQTLDGSFFHVSPSGVNYMLGYAIALEGWSLEGISSGASSSLIGVIGTPPPWSRDLVSDDTDGTLIHGFSQASTTSYGFNGMRISFPVPAQLAIGEVVLKSARIGISSRSLYGTVDPGQAMSLIPVPEVRSFLSVVFSGLLLLRRNRSSP